MEYVNHQSFMFQMFTFRKRVSITKNTLQLVFSLTVLFFGRIII